MNDPSEIQVAITAAGDSRPMFLGGGFGTPKSLVEIEGRTVLSRAIRSYSLSPSITSVAINRAEDTDWDISAHIHTEFPGIRTVLVPEGAKGALVSALFAIEPFQLAEPLVVAAGDSEVRGGIAAYIEQFLERDLDAAAIAFRSSDPRYSYLAVNPHGQVIQASEKRPIGEWATTGVFLFKSVDTFVEAATWCLVNNASLDGIFYVSAALNYVVSESGNVGYLPLDSKDYRPWAVPADFRGSHRAD